MNLLRTVGFRILFLCLLITQALVLWSSNGDSLQKQSKLPTNTNELYEYYTNLGNGLRYAYPDSALVFYRKSLQLTKKTASDLRYADVLGSIGSVWAIKNQYDSAIYYCNKSLELHQKAANRQGLAKIKNSIGLIELQHENYQNAQSQLQESIRLGMQIRDSNLLSKAYNNLGLLYKRKHNYDSALFFYHESLKLKNLLNDLEGSGATANNIALIYNSIKDYDLAEKYINQALQIRIQTKNRYGEAMVLNNYGLIAETKGEYEQALQNYFASLAIMEELNKEVQMAILYNNIGSVYVKQKNFKNAHQFLEEALQLNRKIGNIRGQINSLLAIARFFEDLKIYQNATANYRQALQLSQELNDMDLTSQVYEGLFTCFEYYNQYDSALFYYKQFVALNDSIFNTYSKRNIEKLEIEYQTLKKEKENQDLYRQNQLKEEKLTRYLWTGVGLAVVVALLIFAGFFLIRSKLKLQKTFKLVWQQRNSIQQKSLELSEAYSKLSEFSKFKEELTSMIVHDLKNPLNVILNLSQIPNHPKKDQTIQHAGRQMMNLILNILDVSKYSNAEMVLDRRRVYTNKLIFDIHKELSFILSENGNKLIAEFEYDYLISVDLLSFERIITNLLTNAIKFSPPGGNIVIRTETLNPKIFRLHVIDSGKGIPLEAVDKIFEKFAQYEARSLGFSVSTGLGLTYCKMAVEAHGGKIGLFQDENGGADFFIDLEYIDKRVGHRQPKVWVKQPLQLSPESRKQLQPYVLALADKDVFEVSEIKNIIKQINKEHPEVYNYCQLIEKSVANCNQQSYLELLNLVALKNRE
ncbi:MAG: tetratricopeptide repeat protein [Salinivirgaceae bacterium]